MNTETKLSITNDLLDFINETFPFMMDDSLNENSKIFELGIIDSFGILELLSFIEKSYCISVDEEDVIDNNFASITSIVEYLENKHPQIDVINSNNSLL